MPSNQIEPQSQTEPLGQTEPLSRGPSLPLPPPRRLRAVALRLRARARRLEPWHVILALIVVAFSVTSFLAYRGYVFDDAFITYGYAENLAAGKGFVFNEGERVLGTSTPLYTMVLAAFALFGLPLPATSEALFWISLGVAAALGALVLRRLGHPRLGLLFALFQLLAPYLLPALVGFETTFLIALLLGALVAALAGRALTTGVLLGLAFLTRYDAFLFAAVLLLVLWWRDRRLPLRQGLTALMVVLPWLVFAQLYFGSVLPNTLGAKSGATTMARYLHDSATPQLLYWMMPLHYVFHAPLAPIFIALFRFFVLTMPLCAATPAVVRRERLLATLPVYPVVLWLGYAAIGPPIEHNWYLIPGTFLLVLLAFACSGELLDRLQATPSVARLRLGRLSGVATVLFTLLASGILWRYTATSAMEVERLVDNTYHRGRTGVYGMLGRWIVDRRLSDLTVMMLEPGYFSWLSGNRVIDGAGLLTKGVYFHGPQERRTSPAELVERFEPDLVVAEPLSWRGLPYELFLPLYEPIPQRALLVSRKVFAEQYERFRDPWLERRPFWPGEETPTGHPIRADFSADELEPGWILGGDLELVLARRDEVHYAGKPIEERHLHTHGPDDLWGTISSPPFVIDFDTLAFRFAGSDGEKTAARLLVDGQAVLVEPGQGRLVLRDVEWPVSAWRGKVGVLQFSDTDQEGGYLAADRVRSLRYDQEDLFDDFESGQYGARWNITFADRPRPLSDIASSHGLALQVGLYGALSADLSGRQEMTSEPFSLAASRMSMLVFDFGGPSTRVELRVDGKAERVFQGSQTGRLSPVIWNLAILRGRRAVLAVIDEDPNPSVWIGVDEIRVFDGAARASETSVR